MPRTPSKEVMEAAKRSLNPQDVLNAVLNDMHDDELERKLVDAGLARYVEETTND